jgi:hypothetical protein
MFTSRKRVLIALAVIGLVAPVELSTPAQAETFVFASGPLTNLDPAGATINGGFTKFPTKAGMYIQQCIEPVGTARPATCDDANQLWVSTTGEQGSISSTGPIAMKVSGSIIFDPLSAAVPRTLKSLLNVIQVLSNFIVNSISIC